MKMLYGLSLQVLFSTLFPFCETSRLLMKTYPLLFAGFSDDSALLKHELAYCLGQMKLPAALSTLEIVLRNKDEDPMVRHEVRP